MNIDIDCVPFNIQTATLPSLSNFTVIMIDDRIVRVAQTFLDSITFTLKHVEKEPKDKDKEKTEIEEKQNSKMNENIRNL